MNALEIGKSYICKYKEKTRPIIIRGEVRENTVEYNNRHKRFFDDRGAIFTARGLQIKESETAYGGLQGGRIIREASTQDFNRVDQYSFVSAEQLSDLSKYIPVSHSDFKMQLGSVYVDQMGRLHLINKITQLREKENPLFLSAALDSWDERGTVYKNVVSMRDLVYMRL